MNIVRRKVLVGNVVSDKCSKTRVVLVEHKTKHPLYKKTILKKKRFMIHDNDNKSKLGDLVKIVECRPISKKKRWALLDIIKSKI
jgi:small subunit ribosomal protein S17